MRYLGIDYGSRKIGLALSDEAGTMGFPHAVVQNTAHLIDDVCALIKRERVEAVVIGESRTLAGIENQIAQQARALGDQLREKTGLPIFYESEVFSTEEARRLPHKLEKTRSPKTHEPVDHSAAAIILTSYLSHTNHE